MMARPFSLILLLTAAVGISAQETSPTTAKPEDKTAAPAVTASPAADAAPAPSTSKRPPRAISPELAATLAAGRPKYNPPPPVEKKVEEEEVPDLRDTDKPRNQIIRLPKVVVEGSRPPIFREKEILTRKALAEKMAKRYYSEGYLAFSRFAGYTPLALFFPSAEQSAMARFYEEERLQGMNELNDAANLAAKAGDKADSQYIKAQSTDTYMRRMDWGWQNKK